MELIAHETPLPLTQAVAPRKASTRGQALAALPRLPRMFVRPRMAPLAGSGLVEAYDRAIRSRRERRIHRSAMPRRDLPRSPVRSKRQGPASASNLPQGGGGAGTLASEV